jgi:hypothetical protein
MRGLSVVQLITGVLCLALVGLIVVANLGCAPKYFQRGDVIALLAIGLVDAVLLLGAASGDSDTHRSVGVGASVSAGMLFLFTASIPALFAPIAIAGAFRSPHGGGRRLRALLLIPAAMFATVALLLLGQSFVSASQFTCP